MATAIKASPAPVKPLNGVRYCVTCLAIYRQDFQRCPLDGGTLVVGAVDPWLGATVGTHYVIDGFVGEGAMGRVYRAHHSEIPDHNYAIKILIGDLAATAQMRARFQLEAEHASKLAHPNVVGVIDYGATDQGVNYIVMDLVEGPSLGAIVQQGPMDPARVIKLARQLCEGLEHAHGRGMIHRDFKPDNILVIGEGDLEVARIADFGLALSKDTEVRLTTTGIVCTPAYAAPEQLRGAAIDHRVDLYALGTTMFEMLSGGILPFNGDLDASVRSKLGSDAPSVLMVAPNVPPSLVSIVGRLLSSEPARRPRSARAVIRALDGALSAPRAVMRTDQTRPMRAVSANGNVDPNDSSALPNKVNSRSPSEAPITSRIGKPRRTFRKTLGQLFVVGITLGGAAAWFHLRGPSAEQAAAEAAPAIEKMREPMPSAEALMPTPAPAGELPIATEPNVSRPDDIAAFERRAVAEPVAAANAAPVEVAPVAKPVREFTVAKAKAAAAARAKAAKQKAARMPRPVRSSANQVPAANADLVGANFDDSSELTEQVLANRYGAIGSQLHRLDKALGRENTEDLWAAYRGIPISEAMGSRDARADAAQSLALIQEEIAARAPGA